MPVAPAGTRLTSRYCLIMAAPRSEQLTEAQRICLRLVYSHHSSKEIAAKLGVSPSAVDKRLERAVQILNAGSRFEAARLLVDMEGAAPDARGLSTSERLPSDAFDVPPPAVPPPDVLQDQPWGLVRRFLGLSGEGDFEGKARLRTTRLERAFRLVILTVLIAIVSVALVNLLTTVTSLLRTGLAQQSAAPATSSRPKTAVRPG